MNPRIALARNALEQAIAKAKTRPYSWLTALAVDDETKMALEADGWEPFAADTAVAAGSVSQVVHYRKQVPTAEWVERKQRCIQDIIDAVERNPQK